MTSEAKQGLSALADLRVVELGVWVAAPSAGALLADWGADVVKVEPPSGDPMRQVFGSLGMGDEFPNPAFALDNRGKRSVVLDLQDEEDRARFEDLLADADVFLTNARPTVLDGFDLEPAATVQRHPHLVCCSVSGYGLVGPDRDRPAYDVGAFWGRSGLSIQLANSEGVPLNPRGGIGDHICGLAALGGLLAAVLEQRHTGRGQVVEVSLIRTGTYVLGWDLSLQATLGKVSKAESRSANQAPLMNSYCASDGRWFFLTGLEADRHIGSVCRALGREDLLDDPRFANATALRRHRTEVIATLDEIIGQEPLEVWAERFDREGVWWAPAQGPAEVLADPQLAASDGFLEVQDPGGGPSMRAVNGPVSFSEVPVSPAAAAPRLGEHTDAVLAEVAERKKERDAQA
jgi:crotonobetainyl-CoA:carnitine CoA-transferase CaiB-like acyl-CoA transferase